MRVFVIGLILIVLGLNVSSCSEVQPPVSIATEFHIYSKVLDEERTIVVSLPEGYEKTDARYPVLYLLEGMQNLWHVVGSTEVLTRTGNMPPIIIVGIKSEKRMRDFTPSKVEDVEMSGGGAKFLDFIENELIPYIDIQYKTHPYRILEGHSLSGLFTAYTLMEASHLFDAYIVMSPSFWWNKEELTLRAGSFFNTNTTLDKSIYFGIGAEDGYGMRQELKRFVGEIEKSTPGKLRWQHREFDGEGHMSAPLLINYYALKFIFAEMQLPKEVWTSYSDSTFSGHENAMIKKYGKAARQSQEFYIPLGMKLMKEKNYRGAITVFKRNAEAYDTNNFPPNYAWLAEAYEKNGNPEKALEAYQKAYDLSVQTGYGEKQKYHSRIEQLKQSLDQP